MDNDPKQDEEVQKGDQETTETPVEGEVTKGDVDDDIEVVVDPNNPNPTTEPGHYGTKLVDVGTCSGLS